MGEWQTRNMELIDTNLKKKKDTNYHIYYKIDKKQGYTVYSIGNYNNYLVKTYTV